MLIEITTTVESQQRFFSTHKTKDVDFRLEQLKKLKRAILAYEDRISEALWQDLHKSKFEAYATEIGITLAEISLHIRNLKRWAKPQRVPTNQLVHFWSTSRILHEPYGRVLIISPWNYPFQLLINPLIGALSAGNCVVLKPSEYSVNTARVMEEMISECFSPEYVKLYQGGKEMNLELLDHKWDYIFFTGSPAVGKVVMQSAAQHLTPVSLELGGKSPCIVDQDANLKVAAARIAWGKFINAGQTCIAPDYLFVHKSIKTRFVELLKESIHTYFGADPEKSEIYPRIATVEKTDRLQRFLAGQNTSAVTLSDPVKKYFPPTILENASFDTPYMKEEIFGPILPIFYFESLGEVIEYINANPKPLSLYYFSENKASQEEILLKTSSGGGCINDVLVHFSSEHMPFGGVGNSGIGNYHGKNSFATFSHKRSVLKKCTWIDIPVRYPPYKEWKYKLVRLVMR
jgi:aldehyde dehydrogenase (NAD+)